MTNAYENEAEVQMSEKECCFKPITLETIFHVFRRMFR
jgi:hypothetical protein